MLIRPLFLRAIAAVTSSAVRFTSGNARWTLSNDNLTATNSGGAGIYLVDTNISRSTGPAAILFKTLSGTPSGSGNIGVALYPPGTATNTSPPTTNRILWRGDGAILVGSTTAVGASSPTSWGAGDMLTIRLLSDGTSFVFLKNGQQVATATAPAVSRSPFLIASATAWSCTIEGAPNGETAWG